MAKLTRSRSRYGMRARHTKKHGRKAGVHHSRKTRPNVDTLTSLFAKLNPTGTIKKIERTPMKVEKALVDDMDELASMFGKMKGHKKKPKSKLGIHTKKHKSKARNPFA